MLLADVDLERAEAGKAGIAKALDRLVDKEKIDGRRRDRRCSAGSSRSTAPRPWASCDLVIEAATEREEIKRAIFEDVGAVLGADAILASQHLVDPDHAAGAGLARSGALRRRPFLQSRCR